MGQITQFYAVSKGSCISLLTALGLPEIILSAFIKRVFVNVFWMLIISLRHGSLSRGTYL